MAAVIGNELVISTGAARDRRATEPVDPEPRDDAWIIFTSGSTGPPRGSRCHTARPRRSWTPSRGCSCRPPIGLRPRDGRAVGRLRRVLRGDVLAWRHGACLVPAPALPGAQRRWTSGRGLWPTRSPWFHGANAGVALAHRRPWTRSGCSSWAVRRARRRSAPAWPTPSGGRTPTDPPRPPWWRAPHDWTGSHRSASVSPRRLGPRRGRRKRPTRRARGDRGADHRRGRAGAVPRPRQGRREVRRHAVAGLGAGIPAATWSATTRRGWSSGAGRRPGQGRGRRIELGEIDSALLAARSHRGSRRGPPHRVGQHAAGRVRRRRRRLRPGRVGRRAARDCPTSLCLGSRGGQPSRAPPEDRPRRSAAGLYPRRSHRRSPLTLSGTAAWLQELWLEVLGAAETDLTTSSTWAVAAWPPPRSCPATRAVPEVTVADIYEKPTLGPWPRRSTRWHARRGPEPAGRSSAVGDPGRPGRVTIPSPDADRAALADLGRGGQHRWAAWLGLAWLPTVPWWRGPWAGCCSSHHQGGCSSRRWAPGCCAGVGPGTYPRGGRCTCASGRRAAGRRDGRGQPRRRAVDARLRPRPRRQGRQAVDLHAIPPVTGMLTLGDECSIEPEVDLSGHWIDGDVVHRGRAVG